MADWQIGDVKITRVVEFEAALPPMTDEVSLALRRKMMGEQEMRDWNVREAWGQLLPSASASGGLSWQGSGETQLPGSLTLGDLGFTNQPSYYGSSYSLGLNYQLNWATIQGPKRSKAERRATLAGIEVAESSLVQQVTTAYVELLRQEDAVRIAEQQLENAQFNLRLAQGQLEVGQVTPIDVGQAEVQVGRSEVGVLLTRNGATTSRPLFQATRCLSA